MPDDPDRMLGRVAVTDPAVADIQRRIAWKDFHHWFTQQAGEHALVPDVLRTRAVDRGRTRWMPLRSAPRAERSAIRGWTVTVQPDGQDRAAEHVFVTTLGIIYPLIETHPPTTHGPPMQALSPTLRRRDLDLAWTDGATLGENLVPAMADLLARHATT